MSFRTEWAAPFKGEGQLLSIALSAVQYMHNSDRLYSLAKSVAFCTVVRPCDRSCAGRLCWPVDSACCTVGPWSGITEMAFPYQSLRPLAVSSFLNAVTQAFCTACRNCGSKLGSRRTSLCCTYTFHIDLVVLRSFRNNFSASGASILPRRDARNDHLSETHTSQFTLRSCKIMCGISLMDFFSALSVLEWEPSIHSILMASMPPKEVTWFRVGPRTVFHHRSAAPGCPAITRCSATIVAHEGPSRASMRAREGRFPKPIADQIFLCRSPVYWFFNDLAFCRCSSYVSRRERCCVMPPVWPT